MIDVIYYSIVIALFIILSWCWGWSTRDIQEETRERGYYVWYGSYVMPFESKAQTRWGNSPAGHEALGDAGVKEWNSATKGKVLPEKVEKPKMGLQSLINKQKGK